MVTHTKRYVPQKYKLKYYGENLSARTGFAGVPAHAPARLNACSHAYARRVHDARRHQAFYRIAKEYPDVFRIRHLDPLLAE